MSPRHRTGVGDRACAPVAFMWTPEPAASAATPSKRAAAHAMAANRPQSSKVYRGQPPRNRPRNGHNGNGGRRNGHGNPTLRRLALSRVRAKPKPTNRLGMYSAIGVLGVFGVIGLIGLTFALGTATGLSFLAKMESELPPVSDFEQLDF